MSWSSSLVINCSVEQWLITSIVEGDLFKINHQISSLPLSYFTGTIAQAEIDANQNFILYEPRRIVASLDLKILYLPKPNCFKNRRLAFKADEYPLLLDEEEWHWSLAICAFVEDSPPTPIPTPKPTPVDNYFSNVLLLMHCEGTNNSVSIIDVKKHSFTVAGKIVLVTIPKLFGTASLYFNGTSFLRVPTNEFEFTNDFTVEMWIFPTEYNNARFFACGVTEGTNRVQFYVTSTGVATLEKNTFGVILSGGFIALNSWSHIAISRLNGIVRLFINGTTIATATHEAIIGNSSGFSIGGFINGSFRGYMDEIRVTKGISRYSADFDIPTQPFPDS